MHVVKRRHDDAGHRAKSRGKGLEKDEPDRSTDQDRSDDHRIPSPLPLPFDARHSADEIWCLELVEAFQALLPPEYENASHALLTD